MQEKNRVVVVGGGAAGMMAAAAAADGGAEVSIIEKNEKLGKKLFITGKGRCNVTNAADMDTLLSHVCTNRKFLYSAFYDFGNRALMEWLEAAGCPLKVERGERVFPVSDHSSDVIAAFKRELKKRNVQVLLDKKAEGLVWRQARQGLETEANFRKVIAGVRLEDASVLEADRVIVCTGGCSYPSTGSTGDGYRFAQDVGHTVTEVSPSLAPFLVKESWCGRLMGLSLKNVQAVLEEGGKEVYRGFGELLFTHFGVSGPLVLAASSCYGKRRKADGRLRDEAMLYIDLKPGLDARQLDRRLLRDFEAGRQKQFKNVLGNLLPAKLIPVIVELSGIGPDKKSGEITRQEREGLGKLLKGLTLTVTGTGGFGEAVVTRGGVSVKEVDPSTMGSKLVKGLYFAGEVLDLDALTGGYNLQIAWSTGHLAGKAAAQRREARPHGLGGAGLSACNDA